MTDRELNYWLHEHVMGECLHQWKQNDGYNPNLPRSWAGKTCIKCQQHTRYNPNDGTDVDYCNDLNAVRKVEEKVIAERSVTTYLDAVETVILDNGGGIYGVPAVDEYLMMSARFRGDACKLAWEANQ